MIKHQGVYLPDGETHLVEWMTKNGEVDARGRGTYQIKKLRAALELTPRRRTAIDVGGHCGLWSMQMVREFAMVHAFEPVAAHRECFVANLNDDTNYVLYPVALGETRGKVSIRTAPTSSGDSWVDGHGDIDLATLDSFAIPDVDFIKLDCEGYELFALRGGEETVRTWRPTIIVEQKPGRAQKFGLRERGAVEWLLGIGYKLAREYSGDFIMVPRG